MANKLLRVTITQLIYRDTDDYETYEPNEMAAVDQENLEAGEIDLVGDVVDVDAETFTLKYEEA